MNANTSIPPEIADTIIATIIYFAATSAVVPRIVNRFKRKKMMKASMQSASASNENTSPDNLGKINESKEEK